jgi:hypothetical protein
MLAISVSSLFYFAEGGASALELLGLPDAGSARSLGPRLCPSAFAARDPGGYPRGAWLWRGA